MDIYCLLSKEISPYSIQGKVVKLNALIRHPTTKCILVHIRHALGFKTQDPQQRIKLEKDGVGDINKKNKDPHICIYEFKEQGGVR